MQPDPMSTPPVVKKTAPWVWILVGLGVGCLACTGVGAAILFPVFAQARIAAKQTITLSNLKQVGRAMLTYTSDFDDKFPPNMSTLSNAWPALQGYMRSAMPESQNNDHPEFLGNEKLSAASRTAVVNPGKTLEFFDSAPWTNSKRVAVFVDGSARKIHETTFQEAVLNTMTLK